MTVHVCSQPRELWSALMYTECSVKQNACNIHTCTLKFSGFLLFFQEEGYSHLEFDGVARANMSIVEEHYEMNAKYRGEENVRGNDATPDKMGIYEIVNPQEHTHRPLSVTRSAPSESPTCREQLKPKLLARRSSRKSSESPQLSTDQSSHHNDLTEDDASGKVVGVVKLAPAPAPRRWKKTEGGTYSINGHVDEEFNEEQGLVMEDEDFYCIPPDAGTPEPSSPHEELATNTEMKPLNGTSGNETGDRAGEEGMDDLSEDRLPESVLTADSEETLQTYAVDDGRASSSSLVRECLAELDFFQSKGPHHVMVNIDQMKEGEAEDENDEDPTHTYENQEIVSQREGERRTSGVGGSLEKSVGVGLDKSEEDLSKYDMQTVRRPDLVPDARGYCQVEMNEGQALSLVDEVMVRLESNQHMEESAPPLNDLTNYDLQTVTHPPVITNAHGYSYCDVGFRNPMSSGSASNDAMQNGVKTSNMAPATTCGLTAGYSEIDIISPTKVASQQPGIRNNHHLVEILPKPVRNKVELNPSNGDTVDRALVLPDAPKPALEEDGNADLFDNDGLYARVLDIKAKKEEDRKADAGPKSSPKPKRKKQLSGDGKGSPKSSPKVRRKPHGRPQRRPPPPPPVPGNPPRTPLPLASEGPSTPPSTSFLEKWSPPLEKEHRFEQTLPPLPSCQPGSPSHHAHAANPVDDIASALTSSLSQAVSPKLPGRKGPLPPSALQGDPPSPSQRWGIFNRVKSNSLRTHKLEGHNSQPSSPLADEVGRMDRKGEQSPKLKWFRFRRGSGNTASIESPGTAEEGSESGSTRRRRKGEDKLPEVPDAAKTMSLPSSARQLGAPSGVHLHPYPYEGEEEEEDDLYSVVDKPENAQPQVSSSSMASKLSLHVVHSTHCMYM